MLNVLENVKCSATSNFVFDETIPGLVSLAVTIIQIAVPILLIVFGMLDMGKAVIGNDEKAMKEQQGKLIKRIIYAVVVFLIVALVKTVFGVLSNAGVGGEATSCIDCFISNECVGANEK